MLTSFFHNPATRLVFGIVSLICIAQGLWYIAFVLALICLWIFPLYIEVLILGFIYDSLFGFMPKMGLASYSGTIFAVVLFIAALLASRFVRK